MNSAKCSSSAGCHLPDTLYGLRDQSNRGAALSEVPSLIEGSVLDELHFASVVHIILLAVELVAFSSSLCCLSSTA